ncbi:cytochrome c-type biogenesis protein [Lentisalinibacter sediminis]|uniref:cytochrome c-type biogenesis protein n=1 Tax=Lentisalinibacter sediminis TaxID=2992237 RepID=UPI00387019D3
MKLLKTGWLALLMALTVSAFAIDKGPAFEDPATQARYEELIDEIRCATCQNQSIKDSNAMLAEDLRREIREMISEGKSNEEILLFLTDRYGEFVLYRPPFDQRTALLWGAPVLLLLIAAFVLLRVIRRRTNLPIDDES